MYQSKWCALFILVVLGPRNWLRGFAKETISFCEIWIQMCPHSIYWSHNIWFKIRTQWLLFFSRLELFSSLVSDWFWYSMRIFLCPMFPYGNQFYKFLSIERQTQKLNGTKCVECFIVVLPILYCPEQKIVFFTFAVDVFAFILRINVITSIVNSTIRYIFIFFA